MQPIGPRAQWTRGLSEAGSRALLALRLASAAPHLLDTRPVTPAVAALTKIAGLSFRQAALGRPGGVAVPFGPYPAPGHQPPGPRIERRPRGPV